MTINFSWMFYNCSSINQLDLRGWKTKKADNMKAMLGKCTSLKSINVSGDLTIKSVKDLSGYQYTYCTPLHLFDERTVTSINVTMEIEKIDLCDEVDPDWFIFYD